MNIKTIYNPADSTHIKVNNNLEHTIPEINQIYINLSQLQRNFNIIRNLISTKTKFMAILKGNAYGHGIVPIAQELVNCKCDYFGVVRLNEAITLRKANINIPIMILSPILPSQTSLITKYNITTMVDNEEILEELDRCGAKSNKIINIHVKINTGLNRYGIKPENAITFIHNIYEKYSHIFVEGVYTHFQDPDYNPDFTNKQIKVFDDIIDKLEKENIRPKIVHAANSTGILKYPESHYDMVRCGIILYGLEHTEDEKKLIEGIKPLFTFKSRIIKIKKIKFGECGGYGNNFIAQKDSIIAIVGAGYGDGISRKWKEVLIAGHRVPVVNFFMDCIMVDISSLKENVKELDEVVFIGDQGNESISFIEASKALGSYADEQVQRITERVPRNYFYE